MKKTQYNIIDFPAAQFAFFKQKSRQYSVIIIGENIAKEELKNDLSTFNRNHDTAVLAQFFKEKKIHSIGLIKSKDVANFSKELSLIQQKIDFNQSYLLVLLNYASPNVQPAAENILSEECFLMSANEFAQLYSPDFSTGLCYDLIVKATAKNNSLAQIAVHQIGHPEPWSFKKNATSESVEVIMPHRGSREDLHDLEAALWYLKQQKTTPKKVSVCFDETITEHHFTLADEHPSMRFFANLPAGVGPYPSRDVLARSTEEDIILFHDSDDISTTDRVAILSDALRRKKLDAVGSHELRINKIKKRIEAIRYVLDVTGVENKVNRYTIFFPTTAIKKAAYLKSGGLSTVRKHSSDSQFYWRAHFFLQIQNVDEFLYIRSKRPNSLTTASATALGTSVRERLKQQWRLDFLKIQHLNLDMSTSTLIDEPNVATIDLLPLEKQHRKTILAWQESQMKVEKNSLSRRLPVTTFPDEKEMRSDRILNYRKVKNPSTAQLKASFSWRIGWAITRVLITLFGWIPYVRKRL